MKNNKTAILTAFLTCLLLLPNANAQDVVAQLDLGRRDPQPDFIEYSPADGGLVTMGPGSTHSTRYVTIRKYDKDLKPTWTQEVMEQNGRKNLDFLSVIGENILVFVSEFFLKEGVIKTYYYRYDLEGNLIGDQELLSVYPNQKEQKVELQYVLSTNKRKLLCYKNLENRRESEKILYYVFDEDGTYTRSGEIGISFPDNQFTVKSVQVSNDGNVFLLGKLFVANRVSNPTDFKYIMYRFDTRTEERTEVEIDLGDRFITDLAFKLDRDENIYLAGFYSYNNTDRMIGTIMQKINAAGEKIIDTTEPFSKEFLANYLTDGQINRGRELRNFYLNKIVLRSDGGVLLLAEKFYITYRSYRDAYGYWVDREVYHYEDVILTSVSASGKIEWQKIVEKTQMSENPATLSYFNAMSQQGAHIFYEYRPQRLDYNIYYNTIDIDGNVSQRMPLLKDYRSSYEYYPRFCQQINSRESIMVYFQARGKILSIVRVGI
jgi:hypothetical protein